MSYRIADWANNYFQAHNKYTIENKRDEVLEKQTADFKPYLLLCNLNPIKGTRIFLMANGSKIYDILSDANPDPNGYQNGFYNVIRQNLISKNNLKECSHNIQDMLKECKINQRYCPKRIFKSIWHNSRMCYQFFIDKTVSNISWTLDPEEYDYLIPNDGLVGFRLFFVSSIESQNEPLGEGIIAGPLYQTNIIIKLIKNNSFEYNKKCQDVPTLSGKKKCYDKYEYFQNVRAQFYLHSQYYKSPFFSQLQSSKSFSTSSRNLKIIQKASIVQQRAYLRYTDKGLFFEYQQLTLVFRNLFHEIDRLHKYFIHLNISINSDHRYFRHISSSKSKCNSNFLLSLNMLMKMLKHYENYRLNFPLLRQLTYFNQYQPSLNQLTLLTMIFGDENLPQMKILHSLQQQLNTIVSVKLQLKEFIQSNECQLDLVENLQTSYLKQLENINSVISTCINTLKDCNEKLETLKNSASYIKKVFSDSRSNENIRLSMKSLVTINVDIISQPLSETLKQINNPLTTSHPIAEILGIICGTLGGAVPLLMLLEWCYRYKKKSTSIPLNCQPKSKPLNVPSPSTEHIELSSDIDSTHHTIHVHEPDTSGHIPDPQRSVVFVF